MHQVVFSPCFCYLSLHCCSMYSHQKWISGTKENWSALAVYLAETAALRWQSGGGVSPLWAQLVDWQAPLIGIDVATRCVSVLWLLISPGVQRRPPPAPCCYSEIGVTMIKSSLKHSLCVEFILHECDMTCVFACSQVQVCACAYVGVLVWVCRGLSASRLYCDSVYLCPSPTPTHQSLHTNSSLSSRLSSEPTLNTKQMPAVTAAKVLGGTAKIWSFLCSWREHCGLAFAFSLNMQITY